MKERVEGHVERKEGERGKEVDEWEKKIGREREIEEKGGKGGERE